MNEEYTYEELYPTWDPDAFRMPGETMVGAQDTVAVVAFKASRAAVKPKGGECPCCGQHVQIYRRSIYKKMAVCLRWIVAQYRQQLAQGDDSWVNLKDGPNFHGGDNAKLVYWSVVVRHPTESSLYKPTEVGGKFVDMYVRDAHGNFVLDEKGKKMLFVIPRYAYVYNGEVLGYSTETHTIKTALKNDFSMDNQGIKAFSAYGGFDTEDPP